MKQKPILPITGLLLSTVLTGLLFFLSGCTPPRKKFERYFPPHPVTAYGTLALPQNAYYIAGGTQSHIYLGRKATPLQLLVSDMALTGTRHVTLRTEGIDTGAFRSPQVTVDPPYFYIADGILPAHFRGTTDRWLARCMAYDSTYFSESVPLSSASVAIRSIPDHIGEYTLGRQIAGVPGVKFAPGLLEKQVDGIFCTDGMLRYDRETARLVYVYFYRNQYIVMDTSLNLVYRGHTIDTTTRVRMNEAPAWLKNGAVISTPSVMVNKQSCISGNRLFVHSRLRAENEDPDLFEKGAVIDVYNLDERAYEFSFYILDFEKSKLQSFRVFDGWLVALSGRHIRTYRLALEHALKKK